MKKYILIILLFAGISGQLFSQKESMKEEKKYGLVLGGGGALGFAHIGAIKALEEEGIRPKYISGASMGAVIGVLYAYGYTPDEMIDLIERHKAYKINSIMTIDLLHKDGFSTHKKLIALLNSILPVDSFDSLKCFYALSMTDFVNFESVYASSGNNLKQKVIASVSIPLVYQPVVLDGYTYVDGGLMNNLPIEPLQGKCDKIIMIDVNMPSSKAISSSSKMEILNRTLLALIQQGNAHRISATDFYINFEKLGEYNMFDFKDHEEIIQIGYDGMKAYIKAHPELKQGE